MRLTVCLTVCLTVSAAVLATPPAEAFADGGHSEQALFELVDAAAQRLQTADPVAATKWLSGAAITDPQRVAQVLTAVSEDAESQGLPAAYVSRVFGDQIDASEAVQYSRFSWWKLDPAAAPSVAPDLDTSRSQIDALNRRIVGEIAEQWPVLHSPGCPADLDAAKSAVAGARQLDPLHRQALDTATRSYCAA
ncbi:MAG: chorismate mutase [Mycobacterium sp.]